MISSESNPAGRKLALSSEQHVGQEEEETQLLLPEPHDRFARKEFVAQWVPDVDPDHPRARTFRTWSSRREVVLSTSMYTALVVLIINVVTTIVFTLKYPAAGGIGTIFKGSHRQATRLSSGVHVLINILSTLLLGASNMCMQLCVAPTRTELNKAHAKCEWLDIGTPSLKNLRYISSWRIALVVFLSLTSIPLHFIYNSAVFPSLAVNTYEWMLVNENFFNESPWNFTETYDNELANPDKPGSGGVADWAEGWVTNMTHRAFRDPGSFQKIHKIDCFKRYTDLFGARSDLILVTKQENKVDPNNSFIWMGNWGAAFLSTPGDWMCWWSASTALQYVDVSYIDGVDCDLLGSAQYYRGNTRAEQQQNLHRFFDNWNIANYTVDHCRISEHPTHDLYTVEYSKAIMIAICVANLFKFMGILATLLWYKYHTDPPISILGDAVASFLEDPDPTTKRLGICTIADIHKREKIRSRYQAGDVTLRWRYPPPPTRWYPTKILWFHGASKLRWLLACALILLTITIGCVLLGLGINSIFSRYKGLSFGEKLHNVYSLGFGTATPIALVNFWPWNNSPGTLYTNIFFANSWQFAVSFLYLLINALLTSILVGSEWAHYARHRKPLRVSAPTGLQRSSFFISMPYKYGIPLMASSSLLHWTVSQSVFVMKISAYTPTGQVDPIASVSATGYNPKAITVSISLGVFVLSCICGLGLRKYSSGMPLASTCSAAISAACHPPDDDVDARYFPVMWGVVERNDKGYVYCTFTTAKDARPLGESSDWSEKREAEEKKERKAKKKEARWISVRRIGTKNFWTSLSWKRWAESCRGGFHRNTSHRDDSLETVTEEKGVIDIMAAWPDKT